MAARKSADEWARIQREYLAGEDSIREIADRYEISEAAIRKRAKAEGWERPVRTREPVRTLLPVPRAAPVKPAEPPAPIENSAIVDHARQLVARMLDELDTVTSYQGELEEVIEIATANDENDQRRDAMMKAVSLPARSQIAKNLASALKTINEADGEAVPQTAMFVRKNNFASSAHRRDKTLRRRRVWKHHVAPPEWHVMLRHGAYRCHCFRR